MSPYAQQIWYYFIPFIIIGVGFIVDTLIHGTFRVESEKRGNLKFLIGVFLSLSTSGELIFFYLKGVTFLTYTVSVFAIFYVLIPLLSIALGAMSYLVVDHKFNRSKSMSSRGP